MSDNAFVHVRDLRVVFRRDGQTINAVNGVSFDVQKGEVMALIGESGSGKSVTLRALMRLHPPGSSELSGTLRVGDDAVLTMSASQLRRYRGGRCAMIFRSRYWPSTRSTPLGSRLLKGCVATKGCRARRPGTGHWRPCARCAFPAPSGGWTLTRTRCPAGCASGR